MRTRRLERRSRNLATQVIVVTGASSGIGLETAYKAARRGARVVLVSRDEITLRTIVDTIEAAGGIAVYVVADVADAADVDRVATVAAAAYGGFETWVNNAGVGAYDVLTHLPLSEHRQIFETNYWGTVHGSLTAVRHFRDRGISGTLINVGSVNGDVAIPMLSAYSASKHAVKGFTNALRRELMHAGDDIAVTLIKPSGIATPFPQHARNRMDHEPRVVPPLYAPELVADAILHAAEHSVREITVGAVGPALRIAQVVAPRLTDRLLAAGVPTLSRSRHPLTVTDNLDTPLGQGKVHYAYFNGLPWSPYTEMQKRPIVFAACAASVGLLLIALRPRR